MTHTLFFIVVAIAFVFGITQGFTNGGSLVATVVTTRAMEPFWALCLVAFCEIAGLFLMGQAVSHTLAQNLVVFPASARPFEILGVLASAFLGALVWNTGMWYLALPSSSSHAWVGGIVGAILSEYGSKGIYWPVFVKIFIFLGIVPMVGAFLGFLFSRITYWLGEFLTPAAAGVFRSLQIMALGGTAMVHGSNDGQKCMAMILMALAGLTGGRTNQPILPWAILLFCGGSMALGVIFGSRRIIRTLGKRLYQIEDLQAFCAETITALLVGFSSLGGIPMSTSQVMSTSVLGAGVAVQPRDVRWNLVGEIGLAWLVTIPAAAGLSAALVWATHWVWAGF